nr:MAG TPA_asm: MAEBL protein [Caudoviricetes sp.]
MENSVLSDAAGVQKNISKMYEDYAHSIGKSTDALTQAEKAQAVYNGIMEEAGMFAGSATEMASGYQGVQAQLNATNLELSRTIGESMIPSLTQYNTLQLQLTKGITEFIKNNKTASSGIITLGVGLLSTITLFTGAKTAISAYSKATGVANTITKTFTASLMSNPLFWGGLAITAGITALNIFVNKQQEIIDKANEATEKLEKEDEALKNFIKNGQYTDNEKQTVENAENEAAEIVAVYEGKAKKIELIENRIKELKDKGEWNRSYNDDMELDNLESQLKKAQKSMEEYKKEYFSAGQTIDFYKQKVDLLSKSLEVNEGKQAYANATNQSAHRQTLINIAQTKADIQGKQELLDILKKGQTTTEEYTNAKTQLVKVYPELAKVNENTINSTQAMIDSENAAADAEWALAQVQIQKSIVDLQTLKSNKDEYTKIANAMQMETEEVTASLQNQINILSNLAKLTPNDFKGTVTSSYTPKRSTSSSSKTYQNKALDNYKKQIEYKKALDQISVKQEISMYEYALKKYAKTSDEKNEIRQKVYELNKELAQKEKDLIDQQTEDYENYIQDQKNARGAAYDITEQTTDYNKIIQIHRNYLNQIMKDERLSLDERKEIYREELNTIRDYEQQKRDLRVEQIDNTVTQLTNAITKQLEEMQEKDKAFIDAQIEEVEKLKEIRINAINAEYDAKIEAIEKELEALDKAEQQKSRDEEDAEYEKKKIRLQQLIDYEHDATTKANYQKELDKLVAEYQKTLDSRALEDKKEALNAQKDLLEQEQEDKTQAIEDETDKQKEQYNKQLENLEDYYSKQIDKAQETAEKMLLNVEQNQDKILELLKSYGDAYEITGQSLGEKLAQGINEGITSKIENMIQRVQDSINAGIESKIKEWTSGMYRYEEGSNKPQTQTINVYQTNNIEQNPEMPSETYRKLRNIDEQLASSLAGM